MNSKVIIIGAQGKMGSQAVIAINHSNEFECVAKVNRQDDLEKSFKEHQPDIAIDFTNAQSVYKNAQLIIDLNIHPVIGSSGLTLEQISTLQQACQQKQLGGIIAPNFSIGAILMMKFSAMAANYFSEVELIESHHQQKLDAPSGTALKTAELIAANLKKEKNQLELEELLPGARGATHQNINIHSVRIPGVIAKQEVIFGDTGETLTMTHNSLNRESFMPGVLLSCRKVLELKELIYGLENLI